ncbi:MAG: glycosyltransferase, partial [Planctomycetota bacterium]
MKILFCHNYYRYRGGEDLSFEADVRMLRDEGHQVVTFTRDSRQLEGGLRSKLQTVGRSVYSPSAAAEIRELVRTHQPDILHANNLFPLISHSIFDAARSEGVPSIRALRNYRLFCANSYFYRDGEVCTKCLKRSIALPAIQHGCYRDSRSASMVMVASQRSQRRQIRCGGGADAYFAPSQFARQIHIDGGFDPETIYVKPNFVDPDPGAGVGGEAFLFVGRLSSEKGLDTLLQCWRKSDWPHRLDIVGRLMSQHADTRIRFGDIPQLLFQGSGSDDVQSVGP